MKEIEKSLERTKAPFIASGLREMRTYIKTRGASIFKRSAREGSNLDKGWREQ